MNLSDRLKGLCRRLLAGWRAAVAVALVLGLIALRQYLQRRAAAKARQAATLQSTERTGEDIERVESERIRLRHEASVEVLKAQKARKRADEIADRLAHGGFADVAKLVKEWNGA